MIEPVDPSLKKLHTACVEMEAFLWGFVFRPSSLAPPDKGVFSDGSGAGSFREMLDSERAKQMSAKGGAGLSEMLYRELSPRVSGRKS